MEYYKAFETASKPYVIWCGVGNFVTTAAFEASPFYEDPMVVPATSIVSQDGVFTLHIVSGVLVAWTASELSNFRDENNIIKGLRTDAQRINAINNDKFTYDGNDFPMDEVSRLFYACIEKTAPSTSKLRTMANTAYALSDANIAAFMTAYYEHLLLITKHTI